MRHRGPASLAIRAAALALFGLAAAFAVCLMASELQFRSGAPDSMRRAARTGNARYRQRLAEVDEPRATEHLRAAIRANPRASGAWIALGLSLERGASSDAKSALEQAARTDRQYLPAWTLANYAFRHRDPDTFWRAARHAAALAYDHRQPLIELADRIEPDPDTALDLLSAGEGAERDYLDFLIAQQRLEDATKVAFRILHRISPNVAESGGSGDALRLADFTGRLLAAGRSTDALRIWSELGRFPSEGAGAALVNQDFTQAPSGLGFDWRLVATEGVEVHWQPNLLRFDLSGHQPEACPLLEQWVVTGRQRRRLSFEYTWHGDAAVSGLRWAWASPRAEITSAAIPAARQGRSGQWSSWSSMTWEFTPPAAGAGRLRLIHRREPGFARASGTLFLRRLRLDVVKGPAAATGVSKIL